MIVMLPTLAPEGYGWFRNEQRRWWVLCVMYPNATQGRGVYWLTDEYAWYVHEFAWVPHLCRIFRKFPPRKVDDASARSPETL